MVTVPFLAFVAFAALVAILDWRRGWIFAILVGLLQDPARKMTPGTPVAMTFLVMIVYGAMFIAAHRELQIGLAEFSKRFGRVARAAIICFVLICLAAATGVVTFGLANWKVPMLSLFIYIVPVPAVLFGYVYLKREELIYRFFTFYTVFTSILLIGTLLEYLRIDAPALGLVNWQGDYIRFLPGLQIRMVSGFFRGPDTMGLHAATVASIGIAMAARAGFALRSGGGPVAWPWFLATGWGFFCCLISGRRKAVYFVVAFAAAFLWRYFRRLTQSQIVAIALAGIVTLLVVQRLTPDAETDVYARSALTSRAEVVWRLEGGLRETIRQFGIMGAGLGSATQGVRHLLGTGLDVGWQEGGLGKLAVEIGVPGLIAVIVLMGTMLRTFLALTRIGDVPGSSQLLRVTLFALVTANAISFVAAAQIYTDPMLALMTAFFVGCLFATATLDERLAAEEAGKQQAALGAASPATALLSSRA
jgi:hypothetical protein